MSNIKLKAIFYAYSNNALDHLAPYAFMCRKKNIPCIVIYGEDFVKLKLTPKDNIAKIFEDHNIDTYNLTSFKKQGFLQNIFSYIWFLAYMIIKSHVVPGFFKNKIKGLVNRIFNRLDVEQIGKNTAKMLLQDTEKAFVFTDSWSTNKKIQNGFLSYTKGKATIISTSHLPWHFQHPLSAPNPSFCEDIALVSNHWEAKAKNFIDRKEITGTLRYSKQWLTVLDEYGDETLPNIDFKKKILILGHTELHTSDWNRMLNLLTKLTKREDIKLCVLPHVRGMSNIEPPKELKNVWDKKSSLDVAVKKADIVMFWVSSGIYEAVVRNKKVFYLSFLSKIDEKFIWRKNAPSDIVIKNEMELFNALDNYDENDVVDNLCFEKMIWPEGLDPWNNVSNFLDKFIISD